MAFSQFMLCRYCNFVISSDLLTFTILYISAQVLEFKITAMWRLLSIPVMIWAIRFQNTFVNMKCLCNQPSSEPAFLHNVTKQSRFLPPPKTVEDVIPRQCPQNIQNWKDVKKFLITVEYLTVAHCGIADNCRRVGREDNQDKLPSTAKFDFIVVGAGTAGSIVAGRLATQTSKTVLLLEAGGVDPLYSRVPAFYKYFRFNASTDWMFKTSYSRTYCKAGRGECWLSRGKGLGGTAMFNDMIYLRGHPRDCEEWFQGKRRKVTCREIEHHYRSFENFFEKRNYDKFLYGTSGPVPVQRFTHRHKLIDRLLESAKEVGFKFIENFLDKNTISGGFGFAHTFTGNGQRFTPARTYLYPNKSNLLIVLNTHVNKIFFDEQKRAYKLEYVFNEDWDNKMYVEANEEIILSAGAINTPKIMMLSGLGHPVELHKLNIPFVQDLPVGENMKFHYGYRMRYGIGYKADHSKSVPSYVFKGLVGSFIRMFLWISAMVYLAVDDEMSKYIYSDMLNEQSLNQYLETGTGPLSSNGLTQKYIYSDMLNEQSLNQYLETGTGPLSSNGLTQLIGMFSSKHNYDKTKPDIQILFSGMQADCSRTAIQNLSRNFPHYYPLNDVEPVYNGSKRMWLNGTPFYGYYRVNIDLDAFVGRKIDAYILLLNPKSTGKLTLKSNDPKDYPNIEANFFENNDDMVKLIEGGRIVDRLFRSKAMGSLRLDLPVTYFRPCAKYEYYSIVSFLYFQTQGYFFFLPNRVLDDDFFACLAKHHTVAEYHQQGTASIGTVVDENLLVKKVSGLRVVDGSVIPTTLSGSPQGTIMMFAERAVDSIINELRSAHDINVL